jgi:hypothetical protein
MNSSIADTVAAVLNRMFPRWSKMLCDAELCSGLASGGTLAEELLWSIRSACWDNAFWADKNRNEVAITQERLVMALLYLAGEGMQLEHNGKQQAIYTIMTCKPPARADMQRALNELYQLND